MSPSKPKSVLSIQSHVAFGHVGNAAAVLPLQRMGFEVWPVMTVQFSNHTGYGAWTGDVFTPDHILTLISGMIERGALHDCDALLSGYMGDASLGNAILHAREEIKARNPHAIYACDPVMGDVGRGIFVRPEIPDFMRENAVPAADVITPNQFELELLTGVKVATLDDALRGARRVLDMGPKVVLVTSLQHDATPEGRIEMLGVTADGAWLVDTPMLPLSPSPNGAGDAVSALFLGHLLKGEGVDQALAHTGATIYKIFEITHAIGTRELQLVASQDFMAAPEPLPLRKVA